MIPTIQRRYTVSLALVLVSIAAGLHYYDGPTARPRHGICTNCNVILFSADSVRADRLSIYGYPRPTTPIIEEFSKEALVFQNYFVSGTLTPTSEAAVHTGRYPVSNGFVNFQSRISPDSKTIAEILKANGYSTAAFMTSPEFFSRKNMLATFSRGFDHYYTQWRVRREGRALDWDRFRTWVTGQRGSRKPFFAWVALGTAHWPFGTHAPRKFNDPNYEGLLSRIDRPESQLLQHAVFQLIYDKYLYNYKGQDLFIARFDGTAGDSLQAPAELASKWPIELPDKIKKVPLTDDDLKYVSDLYDNSIYAMDEEFGQMLRILRELSVDRDTIIIFQSQHGEAMMEHGDYSHDNLWESTIKTPLIIRSPALTNLGGRHISGMVSGIDIAPTLFEHLGIDPSLQGAKFDGVSMVAGEGTKSFDPQRKEVFLTQVPIWETLWSIRGNEKLLNELRERDSTQHFRNYGVRTKTHKLIHRQSRFVKSLYSMRNYITGSKWVEPEYELYDLRHDPLEQSNLLDSELSEENKQVFDELVMKLNSFAEDMRKNSRTQSTSSEFQEYL